MLGGRICSAVVIGPVLPKVNSFQVSCRKMFVEAGAADAFLLAYVRPGMRKVNQALGQLVRASGHSGRVLLHCRSLANKAYRSLLLTEYGDPQVLTDDKEFVRWSARS